MVGIWRCTTIVTSTIFVSDDTLWGMIWFTSTRLEVRERLSAPRCAAEGAPVGSITQVPRFPQ